MTAACVVFSFHGLKEKLGTTTLSIHAPVPGFEDQLEKLLNRTFTALQVRCSSTDHVLVTDTKHTYTCVWNRRSINEAAKQNTHSITVATPAAQMTK